MVLKRTAALAVVITIWALLIVATATPASAQEAPDEITVVMADLAPFVVNDNGDPEGFYVEIWDEVAEEIGVEYEVVWASSFGSMIGSVRAGEADVAVAPLAPTSAREPELDFTSAVVSSGPQLGYHERIEDSGGLLRVLVSGTILRILLVALIGLMVLAHLVWFAERREENGISGISSSYLRGIWDSFWWASVTVTTVGYGDMVPRSVRGRALALLAMILSLFLVSAFVSQVTELLDENRSNSPVAELADVEDRRIGVVGGSSFAAYLEQQGYQVEDYPNQDELFDAIEVGEVDFMVTNPFALQTIGPSFGVVPVGDVFYEEFVTFGLGQGSPLREPINQALADLQASGEVEEIVNRWL